MEEFWEREKTFAVSEDPSYAKSKRAYVLDMFPILPVPVACRPSGRVHGYRHLLPLSAHEWVQRASSDGVRFVWTSGRELCHQNGNPSAFTTEKNIANFRKQIKSLGFCYDWNREISTHTVEYYRWTQWIFLQLYKRGLAYMEQTPINWCPNCLTGLSNEEVKEGCCERCGTHVTRKNIRQWILRITAYADRCWPISTHWIGPNRSS
jgi:leucyl-tRNA synthetase